MRNTSASQRRGRPRDNSAMTHFRIGFVTHKSNPSRFCKCRQLADYI